MKQCYKCKEWKDESQFTKDNHKKDGLDHRCRNCRSILWSLQHPKKVKSLVKGKKQCSKCKELKDYSEFNKEKGNLDGLNYRCRACSKNYKLKNRDIIKLQNRIYRQTHSAIIKLKDKKYNKLPATFKVYAHQLTIDEDPILAEDGVSLKVMCKYCGKYFIPTNIEVSHRIQALKGTISGSQHLYCSEECKRFCPIFQKHEWPEGLAPTTSREVDPLLRKLCFEADEWECQRCGKTESLICHHILGYTQYKTLSNDLANVITFCEDCHKWAHSFPGCRYVDLRCDLKDNA